MTELKIFTDAALCQITDSSDQVDQLDEAAVLHSIIESESAQELMERIRDGRIELDRLAIRGLSREVSTHYKWCLHSSADFSVWLNEYKDTASRGYARSVHNHRYSFASSILFGSLRQRRFDVVHDGATLQGISVATDVTAVQGDAYSIDKDVVHQVVEWQSGTATLVLKGPTRKASSQVFNLDSFTVNDVSSISSISPLAPRIGRLQS